MKQYIGHHDVTEAGVQEVFEGDVYDIDTPEKEEWLVAMNRNSPGCLVPYDGAGKAAPNNRMDTGEGSNNRVVEVVVDDSEEEPESTLGQNPGDSFSLLPIDATAGAIKLAEAEGVNLKVLYESLGRRVTQHDVEAHLAEAEQDE